MRFRSFVGFALLVIFSLSLSLPITAQETPEGLTIHVVQRGETLYRIAQNYGVSLNDVARLNGIINAGNIQVGQRLLIPTGEVVAPTPPPTHKVQPGETLRSIATFFGLSTDELAALNHINNPNTIYVGQELLLSPDTSEAPMSVEVPPEPTEPPTAPSPTTAPELEAPTEVPVVPTETAALQTVANTVYVVRRGETLFQIAKRYGLTVNDLVRSNNIADPTLIYVGQQLMIPGFEAPEAAVDLPAPFTSIDVAPPTLIEGKTAAVRITTSVPAKLSATFLNRTLSIGSEENNTRHMILQGIPVFTEAGVYPLDLTATEIGSGSSTSYTLNLQIVAGPYGREYIQLMAGRSALLDTATEDAELTLLKSVTTPFTEPRSFSGPMGLPAAAPMISPFGTRRSYNGGAFDHFHSGTDFAGATGAPIRATAPGRVVLADTLNVRGLATVIDHGWGVYTIYCHQSQQYVQVGGIVTTGQVIGAVGSSGRVTGAHLHWELWVGGVPVDPMQWVQFSFTKGS